ncbi:hypothetical protein BABINDRAFT_162875, partial [Babjeviella inositovora NRRL Y-12698]
MKFAKLPHTIHGGEVRAVSIDPSAKYVSTTGRDGVVSVWDYGKMLELVKAEQPDGAALSAMQPLVSITCHISDSTIVVSHAKGDKTEDKAGDRADDATRFPAVSPEIVANVTNNVANDTAAALPMGAVALSIASPVITCARFSPVSTQLVSCDDTGMAYLTTDLTSSTQIYSNTNGIVDVSWSADGRLIAMACLNNKCVIVDTKKQTTYEIPTPSPVKGVAFDPTNNYLIALGDDKTVQVYQYTSYTQHPGNKLQVFGECGIRLVLKVTNLISKLGLNVTYKRLSWSPEGNFIAIPNANKGNTSLISVMARQSWQHLFSLVGHDHTCEVVAFSPKAGLSEDHRLFSLLASAGSDNSVALWSTLADKPLFVARNVAMKAIVDVAWARDGRSFVAGSLDGSMCLFVFGHTELGRFLSDKDLHLRRTFYSKPAEFIEDDLVIRLTGKVKNTAIEKESAVPVSDSEVEVEVIHRAKEREEKEKERKVNGEANGLTTQRVTTKDGKRRIQPMLVSGETKISGGTTGESSGEVFAPASTASAMEFDQPSYSISKTLHTQLKRREEQLELEADPLDTPKPKRKRMLSPVEFIGSVAHNPQIAFANARIATPKVRSHFALAAPGDAALVLEVRNGSGNEQRPSRLSLVKATPGNALRASQQIFVDYIPKHIHLTAGGEGLFWAVATADGSVYVYSDGGRRLLPPLVLGAPLAFLESRKDFLMAVTCVGEVYVWDVRARAAAFEPASLFAILDATARAGEDGLSRTENITLCSVSAAGVPVVTLSNGNGYLYNKDMCTWCTVSDSWWAFGSQYWDAQASRLDARPGPDERHGIITLLEQKTNEEIVRKGRGKVLQKIAKVMLMKEGFENLENAISLAHLENKILVSQMLQEHRDFRSYLVIYTRRIAEMGLKTRLVEICQALLAGEEELCGYNKKELLKEIILGCAQYRDVQRILTSFAQAIGLVKEA